MGHRLSLRATGRSSSACGLAEAKRLARSCGLGCLLFRGVLHPVQYRCRLHHGGAGKPRAFDIAAADDAGRRAVGRGASDLAQVRGRRDRHAGVWAALASGVMAAPPGAWRGELIMTAAVLCMAVYNVLSRPFMQRSSALGFLAVGMGSGAAVLILAGLATNSVGTLAHFGPRQWIASAYLGIGGGALAFILFCGCLHSSAQVRHAWSTP